MKRTIARLKPYLRWFIWGGVLFFLIKTFKDRYSEVANIRIDSQDWIILGLALSVTICAKTFSATLGGTRGHTGLFSNQYC